MADVKTYEAKYEITIDDITSVVTEVVTLPVEVAERIIEKIEELAVDNEMVSIISIEEVEGTPAKSEGMRIFAGFDEVFGK